MIVKRENGRIVLLTYSNIFHDLMVVRWNGDYRDKFGRLWSPVLDEETQLKCFACDTEQVFPDNLAKESEVQYL